MSFDALNSDRLRPDDALGRIRAVVEHLRATGHMPWVFAGIAGFLAYLPLLIRHFYWLARKDHYQFFPFLLVGIGWLIHKRLQLGVSRTRSAKLAWLQFAAAAALFVFAAVRNSPWCAAVSFFLFGLSLIRLTNARRPVSHSWWLFALTIPLPLGIDNEIVRMLQRISSRVASRILDFVGVLHAMNGNVLEFPDRQFFVEEACSGINSAFVLVAATAFLVVWQRLRLIQCVAMLAAAVFWSTAMNTLRIVAIACAHSAFGIDLSVGILHGLLGIFLYAIALLQMWSSYHLVMYCLTPVSDEGIQFNAEDGIWRFAKFWNQITHIWPLISDQKSDQSRPTPRFALHSFVGICVLAVVIQLLPGGTGAAMETAINESCAAVAGDWLVNSGIPNSTGARIVSFEALKRETPEERERWGPTSKTWVLNSGFEDLRVSFDGPYEMWHDLRPCYEGIGWEVVDTQQRDMKDQDSTSEAMVCVDLRKGDSEYAYLVFCAVSNDAQLVPASTGMKLDNLTARFFDRLQPNTHGVWQFQILGKQSRPFLASEKNELRRIFNRRFTQIVNRIRSEK